MEIPTVLDRVASPPPRLPREGSRIVVAENGFFLQRRTSVFETSTLIPSYELNLGRQEQRCVLYCGHMTRTMHRAMLSFFRYAHDVHGGEAALVLLYHPERRRFRWHCPEQTIEVYQSLGRWVATDQIEFDNPLDLPGGYIQFGDAHLHPGSPTPSAVDLMDDQDGLHIIVGDIARTPSYHIDFVMDGVRFRVPPHVLFEQLGCEPYPCPPQNWLRQIRIQRRKSIDTLGRP